MRRSLRDSG